MAMLLGKALEKLAIAYRQYGNIPLYVETSEVIEGVQNIETDIGGVNKRGGISLVFETTSLVKAENPPIQRTTPSQDRKPLPRTVHVVPKGDNSQTQPITPVAPADPAIVSEVETSKPRQDSARHRKAKSQAQRSQSA